MKKSLTFSQWKKKFRQKPRYKTVELYNESLYGEIDEVIGMLKKFKRSHSNYEKLTLVTQKKYEYGDEYARLLIHGGRDETKDEFNKRAKEEYEQYLTMEAKRLDDYTKLKAEYGD